jgi:hypothetical protein
MREATKSYKAELVGVFGYPVAENPTGVMQEAAFQARELNWRSDHRSATGEPGRGYDRTSRIQYAGHQSFHTYPKS